MHADDVPSTLFIGLPGYEELWTTKWRAHDDTTWTRQGRKGNGIFGLCDYETRTIHLDERLKNDPSLLHEIFYHEVLHACYRYVAMPKKFDRKLEERSVKGVSPILAYAMRQVRSGVR